VHVASDHGQCGVPEDALEGHHVDPRGKGSRRKRVPELVGMGVHARGLAQAAHHQLAAAGQRVVLAAAVPSSAEKQNRDEVSVGRSRLMYCWTRRLSRNSADARDASKVMAI
jgi:hypothetical protein